jgi:hypothetical protein
MPKMYINRRWDSLLEDYAETYNMVESFDDLDFIKENEENGPIFEVPMEIFNEWLSINARRSELEDKIKALEPSE